MEAVTQFLVNGVLNRKEDAARARRGTRLRSPWVASLRMEEIG